MALGSTRKHVEKRIKGIYMKQKSKLSIKVTALLLICIIGVSCFTTACQPTTKATTTEKTKAAETKPEQIEQTLETEENAEVTDPPIEEETSAVSTEEFNAETPAKTAFDASVTHLTEQELKQKAIEAMKKMQSGDISADDIYISDDAETTTQIEIMIDSDADDYESKCWIALNSETGKLEGMSNNLDELKMWEHIDSVIDERSNQQDIQKVVDTAVGILPSVSDAKPQVYYIDGLQATFDANDSISTDCHILMDNGDHYVVSIIYPGYTVSSTYKETYSPFPAVEEYALFDVKEFS